MYMIRQRIFLEFPKIYIIFCLWLRMSSCLILLHGNGIYEPQKETMHDNGGWAKAKTTAGKSPSYSMSTMLIALGKR